MTDYRGYRGKVIDGGEWVQGYYLVQPTTLGDKTHIIYDGEYEHAVDPSTVGQYTGLQDKNEVDIFDGDVIKVPDLYETPENTNTTYHNEVIGYEYGAFTMDGQPLFDDWDYIREECEVIGNRWDNPELL